MHRPLLVTAHLDAPLAGDPPRLDALLEYLLSIYHPKAVPGYKIDRALPAPPQGDIPIPLRREWLGPWLKARCSDPILPVPDVESVEYICKRIDVVHAGLLAPAERRVVETRNSWTKSYRLPLRVRRVGCVRWFAAGDRREVLKVLRRCGAVGKKVSDGYGRVSGWEVESIGEDRSWFADADGSPLLMATLPASDRLPPDLAGARADFGACCPPYWHPERYGDIVIPC